MDDVWKFLLQQFLHHTRSLGEIHPLREHLSSLAVIYAGPEGRLISQLVAEAQYDSATMEEFKNRFWLPRTRAVTAIVRRAMEEGAIRSDLEPMLVTELLYSPVYFRLLFQSGPLDADAANAIMQSALEGLESQH